MRKGALDIWYIRNATLWLDIRIALLTLGMLIRGEHPNPRAIRHALLELRYAGFDGTGARGLRELNDGSPSAAAVGAPRAAA